MCLSQGGCRQGQAQPELRGVTLALPDPHPLPPLRPPVPGTLESLLPRSGSSAHLTSVFDSSVPLSQSKEVVQVGRSDGARATGSAGPHPFSSSKEVWEVRGRLGSRRLLGDLTGLITQITALLVIVPLGGPPSMLSSPSRPPC